MAHICRWAGCGHVAPSLESLVVHLDDCHVGPGTITPMDKKLKCLWDGCWREAPYSERTKLVQHLRAHTKEKPFQCPVPNCGLRFSVRSNLIAHGKRLHGRVLKPIVFSARRYANQPYPTSTAKMTNSNPPCDASCLMQLCQTAVALSPDTSVGSDDEVLSDTPDNITDCDEECHISDIHDEPARCPDPRGQALQNQFKLDLLNDKSTWLRHFQIYLKYMALDIEKQRSRLRLDGSDVRLLQFANSAQYLRDEIVRLSLDAERLQCIFENEAATDQAAALHVHRDSSSACEHA